MYVYLCLFMFHIINSLSWIFVSFHFQTNMIHWERVESPANTCPGVKLISAYWTSIVVHFADWRTWSPVRPGEEMKRPLWGPPASFYTTSYVWINKNVCDEVVWVIVQSSQLSDVYGSKWFQTSPVFGLQFELKKAPTSSHHSFMWTREQREDQDAFNDQMLYFNNKHANHSV